MLIYVQSRGVAQENGYCWLNIQEKKSLLEKPNLSVEFSDSTRLKLDDLIDTQKFSIVLVNSKETYYLYITGLKARKERADFMGRQVLNSLLWKAKVTDANESKIRSILVSALQGKLEKKVDSVINPGGKYEFKTDYNNLIKLTDQSLSPRSFTQDNNWEINDNSIESREKLADELIEKSLPNREGLLVLVTSIKSATALKETGVWRALSNRVEFEESGKEASLVINNSEAQKKKILLGVAISIILLIAITFSIIKTNTPPKPEPEVIPIPSTIQKNSPTTSKEELSPSVNLIKAKEISYLISSHIFPEEYGI